MISFSQKFSRLAVIAILCAFPANVCLAQNPRAKTPGKEHRSGKHPGLEKELAATRRAVGDLKKKISYLCDEREKLQLRIKAGDKAGAEIERQLEECLTHRDTGSKELKARLATAEALAKREHDQANRISDAILKQVEAQKQVAIELRETVALVNRERDALLAKLEAKPKTSTNRDVEKRLIAENEKLSKALKVAWEKAKKHESLESEQDKTAATITRQQAVIDELQKAIAQKHGQQEKMEKRMAANSALAKDLKEAMGSQEELAKRLDELVRQKAEIEDLANKRRAELVAEKIERKKLESKLRQLEEVAKLNREKERAAAVAAERAAMVAALNAAKERAAKERVARNREIELKKLIDIAPVYFGKNQSDSDAQEQSLLKQVKAIHAELPDARFSITGHTCTDGTPSGNISLSQRRAQRIADLLVASGLPVDRVAEVKGLGQTKPQSDNATQQGREANRRVEIKVLR